MQNLEQIRAQLALQKASVSSRQDVSKLPALILSNGLLAAAAFACEEGDKGKPKREDMANAMHAVAEHLAKPVFGLGVLTGCNNGNALIHALCSGQGNSLILQRATVEALAFLGYLKRFAAPKDEKEDDAGRQPVP